MSSDDMISTPLGLALFISMYFPSFSITHPIMDVVLLIGLAIVPPDCPIEPPDVWAMAGRQNAAANANTASFFMCFSLK